MDIKAKKSIIDTLGILKARATNTKMQKLVDVYYETIISLLNSLDLSSDNTATSFGDLNIQMISIVECMQTLSEHVKTQRKKFKRGEAVHIVAYDESMRKPYEWRYVTVKNEDDIVMNKQPQLKLWMPHEFKTTTPYYWDATSRRAVRDNNGKIVSFPPGKIGFIDLDYSEKTLKTTTNIRVTFDGYIGYTDYRNLCVHDYSSDPLPEDE